MSTSSTAKTDNRNILLLDNPNYWQEQQVHLQQQQQQIQTL